MYGRYILKRFFYVVLIYTIIIFIYSALFNVILDQTMRTQINEQVNTEIMARSSTMTPEEVAIFKTQRIETLTKLYRLDEPSLVRIYDNAIRILTFKFGKSTTMRAPDQTRDVIKIILNAIPNTLILFTLAIIIDITIGILLGIKKAQKAGKKLDQSTSLITMMMRGMPSWWLAMILIMFFAYGIPIFPSNGMHTIPPPSGIMYYIDLLQHLALPVITLVVIGFWSRAYVVRNLVLGTLQEDFIMSARARGIPEDKVLYGHTLRTAAPPIVTMSVISLLFSVGGNLIFEGVFNWPGMGKLYWTAVQQNDIPVLMGNLAVTTMLYLVGYFFLDLIYGFLDPRIKVGGRQ